MKNKILIVVDMQNDFCGEGGVLTTKEAQEIIPVVKQKIKEYDGSVVYFTADTHYDNYLETPEGKALPVPHCIEGTWGHKIYEGLADPDNMQHYPFQKETFGTFFWLNVPLFQKYETEEVELCGLCTDICVITNALIIKTAFPHLKVTVDIKACAGVTPETHNAALSVMRMCQINVI